MIQALCVGDRKLVELDPSAKILHIPKPISDTHRKKLTIIARPAIAGTMNPIAYDECICNEAVAIRNRVCGEVPVPNAKALKRLRARARRLARRLPKVKPWELSRGPSTYSGRKRLRYERAAEKVRVRPTTRRDAQVRAFIKFEKLMKVSDPRMIQHRSWRYNVDLMRYLKPLEHIIYEMKGDGKLLPKGRSIAKGLSNKARAAMFVRKWKEFEDPVAITLDVSRFDRHVNEDLLRIEHTIYRAMHNYDPHLTQLLGWQINNKATTVQGIRYTRRGGRMSGDMNTALGNCILMVLMCSDYLEQLNVKYDLLDDGDDCLVIVERKDAKKVEDGAIAQFLDYGMSVKVENVADRLEDVEWCQSRLVETEIGEWTFARNWTKVLSIDLAGVKYLSSEKAQRRLAKTIGIGELSGFAGLPILQEYALALIRNGGNAKPFDIDMTDDYYYRFRNEQAFRQGRDRLIWGTVEPRDVSDLARASFSKAYGVSPSRQKEIEVALRNWKVKFGVGEMIRPYQRSSGSDGALDTILTTDFPFVYL